MAFKRALVVDDSRLARVALKKLLEEHDLDVAFAESGEQALEFLDVESVDVVFMDHHMPGMDGPRCTFKIREIINKTPNVGRPRICCVTANHEKEFKDRALGVGMDEFISKPIFKP